MMTIENIKMTFRSAKSHRHKMEGSGYLKKGHKHHTFIFFGMCLAVVGFTLLLAGVASAAPAFYDDFSDGKFMDRTGTDPCGRALPEWTVQHGSASDFDASTGKLITTSSGGAYRLEADLHTGVEFFKLSFDYITHIPKETRQDYLKIQLFNENDDRIEIWSRKNDGHVWTTLYFADGYRVGLLGGRAANEPYANGGHRAVPTGVWHHVDIERHPDHKIYIIEDGQRVWKAWADKSCNPVDLEYEQTHSGNIELWDNPHLYHNSPLDPPDYGDGTDFPDRTIPGKITKIRLYWFHDSVSSECFAIDNLEITTYGETTTDTTSPATVTNLVTSNPTANSITLTCTAPGDDGNTGTASEYDIRYSLSQITEANWHTATQCTDEPNPQVAGSTETFTVTSLSPETTYYFALKTADEVPNWSGISNSPSGTTTEETDLVAEWHLDEGIGIIAADTSGNSNDGTLGNTPAWVNGKEGKALSFDGINDYVDCGQGTSLKIAGAITVEAWVKWLGDDNPYFVTKSGGSGRRSYDLSGNDEGTVEFRVGGTDCNSIKSSGTVPIPTGEWVYLVGTYEPTSYVRLFVNGALAKENTRSIPAAQGDNGLSWYIGAREGNQGAFNGVIDEVKIYNRALSAEEVREEYSQNQPPFSPYDPSPSDGATDVSIDAALNWTCGDPDAGDTVTYNVYFGTSMTPPLVAENQSGSTYGPGTLNYSTEYHRRIVATDNHGASNESEVWSFTTTASLPDLAAEWHFDEGIGIIAEDTSGNSNAGTLMDNPAWVNGKDGKALSFDGINDCVDCGQKSSLNITGAITVEAYVNWLGAANPYIVTKTGDSCHRSYDLSGNADGTVEFRVGGTDCNSIKSSGTAPVPTGKWVYLVGTYEPSSYVRLFVNGALAKENTRSIPAAQGDNGLSWYIGAREGNQGCFDGVIDEVKIYNRALSAEEIRAVYGADLSKHPPSTNNNLMMSDPSEQGNRPPVADLKGPYTGTEGVSITFEGSTSSDADGSIVAYEWDFGDGKTATGVTPTHTYAQNGTYVLTLAVIDDDGTTTTSTTTATIADTEPTADFSASPTAGYGPLKVTFSDNSTSHDGIIAWDWDFDNNGETDSTEQNPTHMYAEEGVYTVSLTVYESDGDSETKTKVDYITVIKVNEPPVSNPAGPYTGTEGVAIDYDGSGSYDTDGSIVTYDWDFDDGNTATGVTPTHTYVQEGTYTVTLKVTDNEGAIHTSTTTATIADTEPTVDFSASSINGRGPLTVDFSDNSASYDGIETWEWDFDNDDETDSTEQNPTHEYTEGGVYTVSLKVYEGDGSSDTMTKEDYIKVIGMNMKIDVNP